MRMSPEQFFDSLITLYNLCRSETGEIDEEQEQGEECPACLMLVHECICVAPQSAQ